ncbi:MAG: hypothetical protein PHH59_07495 [Methylovulum sp.]|uniref:hypothetical protein n=1 Tax=Methylovulum sp. TaxID=1916980 RepID=UPI002615C444|nr:hypothetical protein [Methylovulum sp.]MDD2723853.1 hypothetical protein [Methylovulum sp.]MDD5123731.1 hypothetical protein [Methylovulum sp.]
MKTNKTCVDTYAHETGSATPILGAIFSGSVADAGQQLYGRAIQAGFGKGAHLHGVGDGATWTADQIDGQSGVQGRCLTDFYHLCGYLTAAAKSCAPRHEKAWMDKQKTG